jgi:hypothetical protein
MKGQKMLGLKRKKEKKSLHYEEVLIAPGGKLKKSTKKLSSKMKQKINFEKYSQNIQNFPDSKNIYVTQEKKSGKKERNKNLQRKSLKFTKKDIQISNLSCVENDANLILQNNSSNGSAINKEILSKKSKLSLQNQQSTAATTQILPPIKPFEQILNKNDFLEILSQNKEELLHTLSINIDENEELNKIKNNETKSLNSDLTSLFCDLFSLTKFENSKPYKMIDYILNSDNNYLLSQSDKDTFEEIKRTVFAKRKDDFKDNFSTVLKTLYQFFRSDFTESYLTKIFDRCHRAISESNFTLNLNNENGKINVNPLYPESIKHEKNEGFDKKDKFTYQNYLVERLKQNSSEDFLTELNDVDLMKSLIYLCNKNLKIPSKQQLQLKFSNLQQPKDSQPHSSPVKHIDSSFTQLLKENLNSFTEAVNENLLRSKNILSNKIFKSSFKRCTSNAKCLKRIRRGLTKFLSSDVIFKNEKYQNNPNLIHGSVMKLIEHFTKNKEDDYEKIQKKIKKFESSFCDGVQTNTSVLTDTLNAMAQINQSLTSQLNSESQNPKKIHRDVKAFWVKFKVLYYLFSLNKNDKENFLVTDEQFWKVLLEYFTNNSHKEGIQLGLNSKKVKEQLGKKRYYNFNKLLKLL